MKYRPPLVGGRDTVRPWSVGETPSAPGCAAVARGGQRRLPASFEAAREAMERAREPPHPYQQLRLQVQRRHTRLPARKHRRRGMPGAPRREPGKAALPLLLPRRRGRGHRMD